MAILCADPEIRLYDDFLSQPECDKLIHLAKTHATPSTVVNRQNGVREENVARKSKTAFFERTSPLIEDVSKRLHEWFTIPEEHFENFQLTYYETGGFYKAHYDYFRPNDPGSLPHLELGGQRLLTFLVYLNKPKGGGYTSFPNLGLAALPNRGRLLVFENVDKDRNPHPNSVHQADIVSEGEKFILTTWVRERKISP